MLPLSIAPSKFYSDKNFVSSAGNLPGLAGQIHLMAQFVQAGCEQVLHLIGAGMIFTVDDVQYLQ